MAFIGKEANIAVGPLTIVSTHATIDQPEKNKVRSKRGDIEQLLKDVDQANMVLASAA